MIDFRLPDVSGPAAAVMIRNIAPEAVIVFHGADESELDVLHLLASRDTATIAKRLGIAPHTVDWHVRNLMEKLQVHSKLQAVVEAARRGLIEL